MSTKRFTLDDIRNAAEEKYGSTWLELAGGEVELVNVLRLPKEKRKVIMNIAKKADEEGDEKETDVDETREDLLAGLVAACRTSAQGKILEEEIGGDTVFVIEVFSLYMKETQAGEASPSQD